MYLIIATLLGFAIGIGLTLLFTSKQRKQPAPSMVEHKAYSRSRQQSTTTTGSFKTLASIAHDLRTPLTSIRGYSETLLTKGEHFDSEKRAEFLGIIIRNVDSMLSMIKNSLILDKLDNTERIEFAQFTVQSLFESLSERYVGVAADADIQLQLLCPNEPASVYGAQVLVERALGNLIDNSMHYTPAGGVITVYSTHHSTDSIRLTVEDDGCGIPAEEIERVFRRHYRADRSESRDTAGMGLGLSIVKSILKTHSSSLELESQIGVGTKASFSLATNHRRNS